MQVMNRPARPLESKQARGSMPSDGRRTASCRRSRRTRRRGQRADARVDESRGACARRRETQRGALLVALAARAVAQGRAIRPRAARARDPARLRQRRDPASSSSRTGGIACHTGRETCFFQRLDGRALDGRGAGAQGSRGNLWRPLTRHAASDVLDRLAATIAARRGADPATSYVAALFAKGEDAILKKIGEEATETVMAAKDGDKLRIAAEVADLWFHCLVLLALPRARPGGRARRARAARRHLRRRREGRARPVMRAGHGNGGWTTEKRRCRTASSARSCGARSRRRRSTRTTNCWRFTTSIPQAPVHFMLVPKRAHRVARGGDVR